MALPYRLAPLSTLMLEPAIMVPWVTLPVPRVADSWTAQNLLQKSGGALMTITCAPLFIVRALPT
jgi:hypothetical protein